MRKLLLFVFALSVLASCGNSQKKQEEITPEEVPADTVASVITITPDIYPTNKGELKVSLVGHSSLIFEFDNKIIHVDPFSNVADYSKLPKADLIMLTHDHGDHLDTAAINLIKKADTRFIVSKACAEILGFGEVIANGGSTSYNGAAINAIPAYNIEHKNEKGVFYHPKGRGNGYILSFGDKVVYVAGDTENIPEMDKLKGKIDIAFLPKNLPYTMTDEMFIDAVERISPRYLYPYHFSEYNEEKINTLFSGENIEILVRPMINK